MNLQPVPSLYRAGRFESRQHALRYQEAFMKKFESYLVNKCLLDQVMKHIEEELNPNLRKEYMDVIIALGDYFLKGLDDYEYDPILPYYQRPTWTRDELIAKRKEFLRLEFPKYYKMCNLDFEKVYKSYMKREHRFGLIVFSSDGCLLVIKPRHSNKLAFPKAWRKTYKYTECETAENGKVAAVRITHEKTTIPEDQLLPYIGPHLTVQPYLWEIKMYIVFHPLPSTDRLLKIGCVRHPDVDYAMWDDTVLNFGSGQGIPIKNEHPCFPYVKAMSMALDQLLCLDYYPHDIQPKLTETRSAQRIKYI